jgi:hypothetical protein
MTETNKQINAVCDYIFPGTLTAPIITLNYTVDLITVADTLVSDVSNLAPFIAQSKEAVR